MHHCRCRCEQDVCIFSVCQRSYTLDTWTVLVPVQAEDKAEASMEEAEDKAEAAVEEAEVAEAAEEAQEGVLVCTWLGQERKKILIRRAHAIMLVDDRGICR